MRKFRSVAILALVVILAVAVLSACHPSHGNRLYERFEADSYRDYASEVKLNVDKYPELARQGLRLITGYGNGSYGYADEADPSDEDVIRASFDPAKGILVIINGLQLKVGRDHNVNMQAESRVKELEIFDVDNEIEYFTSDPNNNQSYDLGKYWRDNGYNVFYFHWEMFADYYGDGSGADTTNAPFEIQERVWTTDNGVQAAYMRDGQAHSTEPGEAVNGSVAELFAADYLRMANAVKAVYPDYGKAKHDVRIAGHSMGGVLTVGAGLLLNLIAEKGGLEQGFVPNRLALMDSYLGDSSKSDYTISWSGKKYIVAKNGNGLCNYIAALDMLVNKFGVAAEFVCNEGFTVPFLSVPGFPYSETYFDEDAQAFAGANGVQANLILQLCPIVLVRPYFASVKGTIAFNGHNSVREWYLSTILYDAPKAGDVTVPTARMSDAEVRALRGRYFVMVNERKLRCETVRCDDDEFTLNKTEVIQSR